MVLKVSFSFPQVDRLNLPKTIFLKYFFYHGPHKEGHLISLSIIGAIGNSLLAGVPIPLGLSVGC